MLIGITYNRASSMVMSLNFTENAQEEANLRAGLYALGHAAPPATQAIAVLDGANLGIHASLPDVIAAAQRQLGLTLLPPTQCAIVDPKTNVVVDTCLGDPAHYQPSGKLMFAAAAAGIGWAYDPAGKTLTSPIEIDPKTLQSIPQTVISVTPVAIAPADNQVASP